MSFFRRMLCTTLQSRPFYVTTPIFYVNAQPHLGHLYSAVVADAVQRFEKLIDSNCHVIFSTGTDEHGTKIQQAAAKHNEPLLEYCDTISNQYKTLFEDCGIGFSDYIRTTEDRHKKAVQHFWNELKKNDFIYSSQYSGWYCVSDETFLTETGIREEIVDGKKVRVSAESGHPVEWTEEKNYMFRLSQLKSDVKHWLKADNIVTPAKYQKILRDMVSDSEYLPNISISRPSERVHWAIPVPDDPSQSIYVWLDALISYLTVIGYPDKKEMASINYPWPCDVQVIGKDILKFHGVYWPAFLMAAGLTPPRKILCHGHWTVDGQKMSKSLNNVVNPYNTVGGLEALRYFLLREGTMHSDANYSDIKMLRTINAELADTFGNLLARCTGNSLNPRQEFPQLHFDEFRVIKENEGAHLVSMVESLPEICYEHYNKYHFYKVVDSVIATLHAANVFFEVHKPWEMKKSPDKQKDLDVILHVTMETLRLCGIILQPIIPMLSCKLLDKLSVPKTSRKWFNLNIISWQNDMMISEPRSLSSDGKTFFQRIYVEDKKPKTNKTES